MIPLLCFIIIALLITIVCLIGIFKRKLNNTMPITLTLRNAIIEAYDHAVDTNNTFEINKYKELVTQVKGK